MNIKYLFAILAAFLISCINEDGGDDNGIKNYVVEGMAVPSFSVTEEDGTGTVDFPSSWFAGKRSVIVFFNSGCGDCKYEMPKVYEAWEELQDEVEFICVSRGEKAGAVADIWSRPGGAPMPYYLDPDRIAFNKFANSYVPRIYLVGEDGKVKHFETYTDDIYKKFSFSDGAGLVELINEKI